MKNIIVSFLVTFSFFLFSMEETQKEDQVVKNIQTIFDKRPEVIYKVESKGIESSSIWTMLFCEIIAEIQFCYFFSIENDYYTYVDLSDKTVLDKHTYSSYFQKILEQESDKIKLYKQDNNNEKFLLIFSHKKWQPFAKKIE